MKKLLSDLSNFSTHLTLSEREIQDAIRLCESDMDIVPFVENLRDCVQDLLRSTDNWLKDKKRQ